MTQHLHFDETKVEAIITTMTHPRQLAEARISWEKGKKWWSRATLDVGTNRVATAVLLPP